MRTPLLLWLLLFVLAVLTAPWVDALPILLFWIVAFVSLLALCLLRHRRHLALIPLTIVLLALSWGWIRVVSPTSRPSHYLHLVDPSSPDAHAFLGQVKGSPQTHKNHLSVPLQLQCLDGKRATGTLLLWLPRNDTTLRLVPGDQLLVRAPLTPFSTPSNSLRSDYGKRMRRQHIFLQSWVPQEGWRQVAHHSRPLRDGLLSLRLSLTEKIQLSSLPPRQKGVAEALILGSKDNLDDDLYRQYKEAGIAHLLCVSGLHVGLVALLVSRLLFFLSYSDRRLRLRCDIQLLVVWLFTILTGSAPSTVRAAIMFSFLFWGKRRGNRLVQTNTLLASALLQMLLDPMVIFQVGFQLSYSAVLGILLLGIPLYERIPWNFDYWQASTLRKILHHILQRLCQWTIISISAELWTLPWVLLYFHQFPTYFLIANLTVVPLAALLLSFLLLFLICGEGLWLGRLGLRLASLLLGWGDALTLWETQIPGAVIDNLYCDWILFLLLFLAIITFSLALSRERRQLLWTSAVALSFALLYASATNLSHRRQASSPSFTALERFEDHQSLLFLNQRAAQKKFNS